jgi:(p)ppGpp synthase/HD superfamily hydrolase
MGILLKRALDQAVVWHRDQLRKYPGIEVPYASHLAGVTVILGRHGFCEEVLAAGALHDAVEDTSASLEDIRSAFGDRVAELVEHVTEQDKSLSWEERKRRYHEHFVVKPWEAQAITLADKIDNLQSIVVCQQHHGDPWAQFKRGREAQLERYDKLAEAIRQLPPHPLVDEYLEALEAVRALSAA